ncbi:unnamed protein product, partial [Amoebophrya sp. A25]
VYFYLGCGLVWFCCLKTAFLQKDLSSWANSSCWPAVVFQIPERFEVDFISWSK